MLTVTTRRPLEALAGAVLLAGGLTGTGLGVLSLARDGQEAEQVEHGRRVYEMGALDWGFLVGGVAVAGLGVFLLVDGLRARTTRVVRASVTLLPALDGRGWALGLGGAF